MKWIKAPSQNYEPRPEGATIKYLIFHYTEIALEESLKTLQVSQAPYRVSAHYLICPAGQIYELVKEEHQAWHAGKSAWGEDERINTCSIGIELVNLGQEPFPDLQMKALEELSKDIIKRHEISPFHILGHSDIAPERKVDPGKFFDWQKLAEKGIGIMPPNTLPPLEIGEKEIESLLKNFGYRILDKNIDNPLLHVLRAFQLHYGGQNLSDVASRVNWLIKEKSIAAA